jgi:nucleotide-binding universal stress UspA family protein
MSAILYASDFSSASRAAFGKAVEAARRDHAELLVTHVMSPPVLADGAGFVAPATLATIARRHRKVSESKLKNLVARAREAGVRARGVLLEGVPAEEILRAARSRHAHLIVVGTHGHRGIVRLLLGSVAARVVAGARCPVLTVRGR